MNYLRKLLIFIGVTNDKDQHFIGGFIISFLCGILTVPILGFLLSILIGGLKELYDRVSKTGVVDYNDFMATVLGGTIGFILLELF